MREEIPPKGQRSGRHRRKNTTMLGETRTAGDSDGKDGHPLKLPRVEPGKVVRPRGDVCQGGTCKKMVTGNGGVDEQNEARPWGIGTHSPANSLGNEDAVKFPAVPGFRLATRICTMVHKYQ